MPPAPPAHERLLSAYAQLPITFIENRGQIDARVHFYARGNGFAFYLTTNEVTLALAKNGSGSPLALSLRFIGSNALPAIEGAGPAGEVNYFHGSDPSSWRTRIPQYRDVIYRESWRGIDLRLREQAGVLKYEFHVRPGAHPSDIAFAYDGASRLAIDRSGALLIDTPEARFRIRRPSRTSW